MLQLSLLGQVIILLELNENVLDELELHGECFKDTPSAFKRSISRIKLLVCEQTK